MFFLYRILLTEISITATNVQSVEDMKIRLEQVKVVAVTCLGISSPVLANMRFDVCIMDEAGQTTLPVCSLLLIYVLWDIDDIHCHVDTPLGK